MMLCNVMVTMCVDRALDALDSDSTNSVSISSVSRWTFLKVPLSPAVAILIKRSLYRRMF